VTPLDRLRIQGLRGERWQKYVTVAGMVAVVTSVLAGAATGLVAADRMHRILRSARVRTL
jgi:hypothetical protein